MRIRQLLICALLMIACFFTTISAQNAKPVSIGLNIQAYPAGIISNFIFSKAITKKQMISLLAGYNFTDRRDFGKHDNEEGGGPGFGVAIRRFFKPDFSGWQIGLRADIWFMEIDWRDDQRNLTGKTDISVLQPTVQAGYRWLLGNFWALDALVAFGAEINIRTKGEDVGEGAILLGGVGVSYQF